MTVWFRSSKKPAIAYFIVIIFGRVNCMSDANTEKRLQLLKQIRSRYNQDQYDMSNREKILYGRSSRSVDGLETPQEEGTEPEYPAFFRFRLALAAGLLGLVIFMDVNGISVAGITAERIFQAISADFEEAIEAWATEVSQPSI